MVYKILTNYVYTGATVGHRRKSGGVGSRKSIPQDREDWIVVEGMHEAIVSKEEFEQAQSVNVAVRLKHDVCRLHITVNDCQCSRM